MGVSDMNSPLLREVPALAASLSQETSPRTSKPTEEAGNTRSAGLLTAIKASSTRPDANTTDTGPVPSGAARLMDAEVSPEAMKIAKNRATSEAAPAPLPMTSPQPPQESHPELHAEEDPGSTRSAGL